MHELLFGHSQVATTIAKEVNFFNFNYDKGPDWYRQQFAPTTAETRLLADISPFYMMDPVVAARIRQTVRNPLLLVNLRSPYERVLSWYCRYRQENHPITALMTDAKVRAETLCIGEMAPTVERYQDLFGRDQLLYVDFSELKTDPTGLAERLQRRLGLDVEAPPSITRQVNASVRYRSANLRRLVHLGGPVVRGMSPKLFYFLKFGPMHNLIFDKRRLTEPAPEEKIKVLRSLYAPFERDIDHLEALLGQDLSAWRYERQVVALQNLIPETTQPARPTRSAKGVTRQTGAQWLMREARTLWAVAQDQRTPWHARLSALLVTSYLFTPLDLIPNSVPIIGHLDEAMAVPLALALLLKLSPAAVVEEHRAAYRIPAPQPGDRTMSSRSNRF